MAGAPPTGNGAGAPGNAYHRLFQSRAGRRDQAVAAQCHAAFIREYLLANTRMPPGRRCNWDMLAAICCFGTIGNWCNPKMRKHFGAYIPQLRHNFACNCNWVHLPVSLNIAFGLCSGPPPERTRHWTLFYPIVQCHGKSVCPRQGMLSRRQRWLSLPRVRPRRRSLLIRRKPRLPSTSAGEL